MKQADDAEMRAMESLNESYVLKNNDSNWLTLEQKLAQKINHLINSDFSRLVNLLYQSDVNEMHLKNALKTNEGKDAGLIIAKLVMQRELEKFKTREKYRADERGINEDEAW